MLLSLPNSIRVGDFMAMYLVRAKPKSILLGELRRGLDSGEISKMRPFGGALDLSLRNAKVDNNGYAVWEEEDYCNPPLAQEKEAVLNKYFDEITIEKVSEGEGWERTKHLPSLWSSTDPGHTSAGPIL